MDENPYKPPGSFGDTPACLIILLMLLGVVAAFACYAWYLSYQFPKSFG